MTKFYPGLRILLAVCFTLALASMAQAQATRTWVSGVGDDANPCSRTAPCKTFAGAISKTFINGEIDCLDPGGFGAVTITKSITIDGGSGFGSILASGTTGVIINVGTNANDPKRRVTLRRLSINGTGASGTIGTSTGIRGVNWIAGNQLHVENCYIQNFTTAGIDMNLTESGSVLYVQDTNIDNTTTGIQAASTTGAVGAMIERTRVENGTNGILAKDRAFINVRDSVVAIHTTVGIGIVAPSNSAGLNIESTFILSCNTGVQVGAAGTRLDISNTSIMQNSTGVASGGGTIQSHGNNNFGFNTSDGVALPVVGQK